MAETKKQAWTRLAREFLLPVTLWLAFVLLPYLLYAGAWMTASQGVVFSRGLRLVSSSVSKQAAPGHTAKVSLTFRPSGPMQGNWWVFLHVETPPGERTNCRVVADRPPDLAAPLWGREAFVHDIAVELPSDCRRGQLQVLAGLYERDTSERLPVRSPRSLDNRVKVGTLQVVAAGATDSVTTLGQRDLASAEYRSLASPWQLWLAALGAGIGLAVALGRRWGLRATRVGEGRPGRWLGRAGLAGMVVLFVLGVLVVLEVVKDDAYISFRYAHNLVTGQGLVFNPGERLEGYTNFLWTLLLAPFEAMGWDLFQVCEWLGPALILVLLWKVVRTTGELTGERKDLSHLWGAFWMASSCSLVLWSKSGLEQPLAALLPFLGAWLLRGADWAEQPGAWRRATMAGVVLGLGCMTRPEIHLIAFLLGLPLLIDAVRSRRRVRALLGYLAGVLVLVTPWHWFRWAYYGSLLPNTFYVKTGAEELAWRAGLSTLREMFAFNGLGVLVVLAPLAFIDRRHRRDKLVMAAVAVAFLGYIVRVGVDEMVWYRLYLPALPFLVVLAASGLRNLGDAAAALARAPARLVTLAGWGLVLAAAAANFVVLIGHYEGINGHGDLSGMYHPDLGKFVTRHERPGGLVAFQDMGSTPYHAPDLAFLDFIGLVDRTVARARHAHGLHAFVDTGGSPERVAFDREMRDYFYSRSPRWAILTVYVPEPLADGVAAQFARNPGVEALRDYYAGNPYQFGLWNDGRFQREYVHVRTWPRSSTYYLSLFRRRDLWEQVPREVVLDAPPARLAGQQAKLTGGLELLGSETDGEALQRHEIFVTTWWRAPGPMAPDLSFRVQIEHSGYQTTTDHLPGDWMYPADRWRPGDVVEDRVLIQLPVDMEPGEYQVYLDVYRRSTAERLPVLEGRADGAGRIDLGRLHVKRLLPLVHQLIPPTSVGQQRRHPDRVPQPAAGSR
jgi:arabinofuranosyltransferase